MHQIHNELLLSQVYFVVFLSMSYVFMKLKVALLYNCIVFNQIVVIMFQDQMFIEFYERSSRILLQSP